MHASRRYLLTSAVVRYRNHKEWDMPDLVDSVQEIKDLLCGEFLPDGGRYEHVDALGNNPTSVEMLDRLRAFCTSAERRGDDYLVVYLTGHGEILEDGTHVLLTADSHASDLLHRTVSTSEIMKRAIAETPVRRLLLLLDTCYSGRGGEDSVREALRRIDGNVITRDDGLESRRGDGGVVVVAATRPYQQAVPGSFTGSLSRAAHSLSTAGNAPPTLRVGALIDAVNNDPKGSPAQTAVWHQIGMLGDEPKFLLNPRYRPPLVAADLLEQERAYHAERNEMHLRERFLPATRWFTGRHRALQDLSLWLTNYEKDPRPRIVTGLAGSGKTAVVGMLAALSDPDRRRGVPLEGLPDDVRHIEGAIDSAIYAGTMTTDRIRDRIAVAAGGRADTTQELVDFLNTSNRRPIVVLVDALDEAADPDQLCRTLLIPLVNRCANKVRFLLGSRPHLLTSRLLGTTSSGRYVPVDLDSPEYVDPSSIRAYVRRILISVDTLDSYYRPSGIYHSAPDRIVNAVIDAIGEAAGLSFLVARITATTETTSASLPNPYNPEWRENLPRRAGEAMRRDLQFRLGEEAERAAGLLLPLAYAQANGMPWEDIWPAVADALSPGRSYGEDDLIWLRRAAGSYAVENTADGRSVYRLYHQALVEHLRDGRDQAADQRIVTEALMSRVPPAPGGRRDWQASHPYIRAHLASHAAAGNDIDRLLGDPLFLLNSARPALLAALDTARGHVAKLNANAYRRAWPRLRSHSPREHASYLQLAARCVNASELASELERYRPSDAWATRWASWRVSTPHHTIASDGGAVRAVAVGEIDGRPVIVSGSDDRMLRVWDMTTGAGGKEFPAHDSWIDVIALTALDGRLVAVSGSHDRTVRAWDVVTGAAIGWRFSGHQSAVRGLAVGDIDGRKVVISSSERDIQVSELATGRRLRPYFGFALRDVGPLTVSDIEGRQVVIAGCGDQLVMWSLATRAQLAKLTSEEMSQVKSIAGCDVNGRSIVIAGTETGAMHVFDVKSGRQVGRTLVGHRMAVRAIAISELDKRPVVVSGSDDGTVRVHDLIDHVALGEPFAGHNGGIKALAVSELDGRKVVVTGSDDRTVRVWDLATGASAGGPTSGDVPGARSVAVGELSRRVVAICGGNDGSVQTRDIYTGRPACAPIAGHTREVKSLACGELGEKAILVSASDDVPVWVRKFEGEFGRLDNDPTSDVWGDFIESSLMRTSVQVARAGKVLLGKESGRQVVVSAEYGRVSVRDLENSSPIWRYRSNHFVGNAVDFANIGTLSYLVVGGDLGGNVRKIRVRGSILWRWPRRLARHSDPVTAIAGTTIGSRTVIASASTGGVLVHDLARCERIGAFNGVDARVADLAWLVDGVLVVAAGRNLIFCDPLSTGGPELLRIEFEASIAAIAAYDLTVLVATGLGVVAIEVPVSVLPLSRLDQTGS